MTHPLFRVPAALAVGATAALLAAQVSAGASTSSSIPVIDDAQLQASTTTVGGAAPQPTTHTVAHWWGSTTDPHNGVTYGYNMVGADPTNCSGTACDVTIQVDITPVVVNVGGRTFDGRNVLAGVLASPQFATNDYGTTPAATQATADSLGPGGTLSQGDAGVPLQLQDATMRAQFNRTGASSSYHLRLQPNVMPAVTIDVPSGEGTLIQTGRGVVAGDVSINWWASRIQNLMQRADPTHLPLYLTDNVMNYVGQNPFACCVIGFHGAGEVVGRGTASGNGNGVQPVQTFAWASWVRPGFYARANGGRNWALQDIHALSHEIAEWGDDPFVNNKVEPWVTPTAPQYGCTGVMETGDPVVGIGFAMGTNTYDQTPNPKDGSASYDGYYHPEDEAYLPWFMRTAPNTISEPTQSASANVGRYTLMGDLNPFPGFREPATGC